MGEPYNLALASTSGPLASLPRPLPVQFNLLEEKFAGGTVHEGRLTAISDREIHLESPLPLRPFTNLKITVAPSPPDMPGGELYGKVMGAVPDGTGVCRIRLTSVTPELKGWAKSTIPAE